MVNWCLLMLTALLYCVKDIHAATYTMLVNEETITGANGVTGPFSTASDVKVACRFEDGIAEPNMFKISANKAEDLIDPRYIQNKHVLPNYKQLTYQLNVTDKKGIVTYRCIDKNYVRCPDYSQVTISFTSQSPDPGPVRQGCPPGGATDKPSVNPSSGPSNRPTGASSSGGTTGPRFAGLNPLIYTISAVILLGTLAIVAIITCWIRARRSYNRRMFQSSANPQDYLDYISDNEFTPLTTSEFVASLQERPPTYNESEEIEGQVRPEGDSTETGAGGGGTEGGGAEEGGGGAQATTTTTTTTTATSTSTNTRSRPPRPPPPLTIPNSNHSQPSTATTTSSSSGTAVAATTSSNGDAPDVTSEDRPPVAHGDRNDGGVPDITGDSAATGVSSSEPMLSGIDALLSMDLNTGNGNGTQPLPTLPVSSSTSTTESTAVGTLIDFGTSNTDTSAPVVSSSQSTFHSLPQPTPEQISEMEAAIGALNEHMTRIRERTE